MSIAIDGAPGKPLPYLLDSASMRPGGAIWVRIGPSDADHWRQGTITKVFASEVTVNLLPIDSPL